MIKLTILSDCEKINHKGILCRFEDDSVHGGLLCPNVHDIPFL